MIVDTLARNVSFPRICIDSQAKDLFVCKFHHLCKALLSIYHSRHPFKPNIKREQRRYLKFKKHFFFLLSKKTHTAGWEHRTKHAFRKRRKWDDDKNIHITDAFMLEKRVQNYLQCVCAFLLRAISELTLASKWANALWILDFTSVVSLRKNVTSINDCWWLREVH